MNIDSYLKTIKNERRKNFITTAIDMGAKVEIISSDFRLLKFSWKNKTKIMYNEKQYFNKKPSIFFTKNKEITKILLREAGLRVPTGIYAKSYKEAIDQINKLKLPFPVVVKPIDAAKGVGVSVGIKNEKELKEAIDKIEVSLKNNSMKSSGIFMVEKMKKGNDFRVLVLNNKVIACVERVPAYIIGDGKSKINKLIQNFNKTRPVSYILKIDSDLKKLLRLKNLTLDSVLENNQRLQLRNNANISSGGRAVDKTKVLSNHFAEIALKSARALGLNYAGIDIMTEDITENNPSQEYFIIEINGAPDYDIHEKPVVLGEGVDVTRILVHEFMNLI